MNLPERYYTLFLLVVCLLIFLPHLGTLPVNIMEARNFITAREMLHDQHWILTTMNGEPRYEKPPLPTWITAASGAIGGLKHVAALRLTAVLMALLLAFTTFFFGKRLTSNPLYALISTLIMVSSFYILWAGRNGQWDIFTHAFMMVSIYQLYLFFTSTQNLYKHALLAALFFGCSFMSKGPVSMYALFLPFLIAFGWVYRFGKENDQPKNRWIPLILFLFVSLILSGWWHLYIYLHDTEAAREITSEEVGNWNSYNVRPFYYYWNFFIQSGTWTIIALVSLIYPYLKNRVFNKRVYTFTLIWTLSAVILLSLIPEKKPRYLLPVLIPLAMNMGFYMEYLLRDFGKKQISFWEKLPVWAHFGLIALVGVIVPFGSYWYLHDHLDGYWIWYILLSISLFITGILIIIAVWERRIDRAFFLTIGFTCALTLFGLPLSNSLAVNPSYKSLSELQDWQDSTGLPVYEFKEAIPELIWAYGKPMEVLYDQGTYTHPQTDQFGLLAYENLEEKVRTVFKEYSIQKTGLYDMNSRGRDQGGHKERLYRDFYVISRR